MEDIPRDIIEQAQAGNIEAFERIYRSTSGFVYSVALRIVNNRQEAQEVTQDVFIKIHRNLKYFEFRSSFKTWAYRIATNTALNACRKLSKETNRRQDLDSVIETQEACADTKKEIASRDDQAQAGIKLDSLLRNLNPDQRACIVLREIEGLSYDEISKALKVNINTVRSRLKRARFALMAKAGSQGGVS